MQKLIEHSIICLSPFAQSHNFSRLPPALEKLAAWELAVPGEDRSVAAARLREAYEKQLTTLDLSGFALLTTLPEELPASLTTLNLHGCTALITLPQHWPTNLTSLYLSSCTALTALPQTLPESLSILNLYGCTALTTLPQTLPGGLTSLDFSGCTALTTLPQTLPTSLATLSFSGCTALTTLPVHWPGGLTYVVLTDCPSLTTLPQNWPTNVTWLDLSGCTSLTTLLAPWPVALAKLTLRGCTSLTTLPQHWPASLISLSLSGCAALTTLPQNWPANLTELYLSGCTSLTTLPQHWPVDLAYVGLTGCTSLTDVPHTQPPGLQIEGFSALAGVAHERWYQQAHKTPEQLAALKTAWPTLTQETGFNTFNSLLERLGEHQLKAIIIPEQVVDVIDEVLLSPQIRPVIFNACQEADQDCHDRILVILNTIQAFAKASSLQRQGASMHAILTLSLGIVRQTFLDESVPKVMQQQWQQGRRAGNNALDESGQIANQGRGTGPNTAEALEVQLALRHQLTTELALPFAINGTLYTAMAELNDDDRALAAQYVLARQNDQDSLAQALVIQPVWAHYLTTQLTDEVKAIKGPYAQALGQFEQANDKGFVKSEIYLPQLNQLMIDRDYEIQTLLTQRTLAMLQLI